jgi:hypothetical protein
MYWTKKKIAEVKKIMKKAAAESTVTDKEKKAFLDKMMSADKGIKKK